jgi:hypothetical protein
LLKILTITILILLSLSLTFILCQAVVIEQKGSNSLIQERSILNVYREVDTDKNIANVADKLLSDHYNLYMGGLFVYSTFNFKNINNIEKNNVLVNMIKVTASSILAEVILKSESGRSMVKSNIPITSENIGEFQPSEQVIKNGTNRFKQLGFTVFSNGLTLTIEGEKSLFEKVFKVKLTLKKGGRTGRLDVRSDKQLSIPASLSDIAEKVVFTPSPEFFS